MKIVAGNNALIVRYKEEDKTYGGGSAEAGDQGTPFDEAMIQPGETLELGDFDKVLSIDTSA